MTSQVVQSISNDIRWRKRDLKEVSVKSVTENHVLTGKSRERYWTLTVRKKTAKKDEDRREDKFALKMICGLVVTVSSKHTGRTSTAWGQRFDHRSCVTPRPRGREAGVIRWSTTQRQTWQSWINKKQRRREKLQLPTSLACNRLHLFILFIFI